MGLGFRIKKGGAYRGSRWFIGRCTGFIGISGVWGFGGMGLWARGTGFGV